MHEEQHKHVFIENDDNLINKQQNNNFLFSLKQYYILLIKNLHTAIDRT